jgi:hypothetical protein
MRTTGHSFHFQLNSAWLTIENVLSKKKTIENAVLQVKLQQDRVEKQPGLETLIWQTVYILHLFKIN